MAERPVSTALAAAIERDAEVQRVAFLDAPELVDQLPDREVWDAAVLDPRRLAPGKMETVALRADDVTGLENLMRSARRYIYIEGGAQGLAEYLEREVPRAVVDRVGQITRVDLMAPSYRIMPFEVEQS